MKLDKKYLFKCYHDAMILQYIDSLRKEGFKTESEKKFILNDKKFEVDLYAERNEEKRIYEFKIIGKKEYQKGYITRFKEFAESINAKPVVVYINIPMEKQIIFEDLDEIINNYFLSESIPSELDELSTHSTIDYIQVDEILSLTLGKSLITVIGDASINVDLQYGSDSDCDRGNGVNFSDSFPLKFTIELDYEYNIENFEYEIDTSDWWE